VKHILETLYVLTPDSYIFHRNDNICVSIGGKEKASVPARRIESIVFFGKNTFSTSLLWLCGNYGITVTFLSEHGRFLGRVCGPVSGNVLLRKRQYESMNNQVFAQQFVRDILYGKIVNSRNVLMRRARICNEKEIEERLREGALQLGQMAEKLSECKDIDSMRGIEGTSASIYFGRFDDLLTGKNEFKFENRSRRPPRNEVNAVLSFLYTQLTHDVRSAIETVGLDPAAGYLHTLRPGRPSFALDLMEELREPLCDRLTLALFNRGQLSKTDFETRTDSVYLNEKGRKKVLSAWRDRKKEEIVHPFLNEKIPIGMIMHAQSMLFARVLRGDLDRYPPFIWR